MRKYVLFLLIPLTLFLAACASTEEPGSTVEPPTENTDVDNTPDDNSTDNEETPTEEEPTEEEPTEEEPVEEEPTEEEPTEEEPTEEETVEAPGYLNADGQLELTIEDLAYYDGKDGKDAYVAVDGIVYDMTNSNAWRNGGHNGYSAGQDLTFAINNVSPHGTSFLSRVPQIGIIVTSYSGESE